MKKTVLSFALITTLLFAACEGGTTYIKTFSNQSNDTITVELLMKDGVDQNYSFPPGTSSDIYWRDWQGSFPGDGYTCVSDIDTMIIDVSGGKTLIKDPFDDSNWELDAQDGRNTERFCTFTVNPDDVQ